MNVNIELKIKMADGKEVTLNSDEAKELLGKLKEIFPEPDKGPCLSYNKNYAN